MVSLPDLTVWNTSVMPIVLAKDILTLQIRVNGLLLRRDSRWMSCRCVLTNTGYFVIYAKEEEDKGYAVNVARARTLNVTYERIDDGSNVKVILKHGHNVEDLDFIRKKKLEFLH